MDHAWALRRTEARKLVGGGSHTGRSSTPRKPLLSHPGNRALAKSMMVQRNEDDLVLGGAAAALHGARRVAATERSVSGSHEDIARAWVRWASTNSQQLKGFFGRSGARLVRIEIVHDDRYYAGNMELGRSVVVRLFLEPGRDSGSTAGDTAQEFLTPVVEGIVKGATGDMSSMAAPAGVLLKAGMTGLVSHEANKEKRRNPYRTEFDFAGKYVKVVATFNYRFNPASREGSRYVNVNPAGGSGRIGQSGVSFTKLDANAYVDAVNLQASAGLKLQYPVNGEFEGDTVFWSP